MAVGVYTSVYNGVGGTISCSCSGNNWSNSGSSIKGGTFSSAAATFTATPNNGYNFVKFDVYIDTSSTNCSSLAYNRETSKNSYSVGEGFMSDGQSYRVRAYFEQAVSYCDVNVYIYLDNEYYTSNTYQVQSGTFFQLSQYVSQPSNSRLDHVYYDGSNKYYYPSTTISNDTTFYVYYKTRPSNWYWTNTVSTGYAINISAAEWNSFTDRINQFRVYLNQSTYNFTVAYPGTQIEAGICNQAHSALNDISAAQSSYSMPSTLSVGGSLPASFFNGLKNVLNALP